MRVERASATTKQSQAAGDVDMRYGDMKMKQAPMKMFEIEGSARRDFGAATLSAWRTRWSAFRRAGEGLAHDRVPGGARGGGLERCGTRALWGRRWRSMSTFTPRRGALRCGWARSQLVGGIGGGSTMGRRRRSASHGRDVAAMMYWQRDDQHLRLNGASVTSRRGKKREVGRDGGVRTAAHVGPLGRSRGERAAAAHCASRRCTDLQTRVTSVTSTRACG